MATTTRSSVKTTEVVATITPAKRGRGRPKGSTNKPKNAKIDTPQAEVNKQEVRQNRGKKYTVFKLESGKEIVFDNINHADAYEQENADIIKETITFDTDASYQEYKAATYVNSPVASIPVKVEELNADEKNMLAKIRQHRQTNAPTKQIKLSFKNTQFSRACLVVFDVMDEYGKPYWMFKARDCLPVLKAFVENNPNSTGDIAKEIVNNFMMLDRRSLEGDDNKVDKTKGYKNYKLVSHFIIPANTTVSTMEEETSYISETCTGDSWKGAQNNHELQCLLHGPQGSGPWLLPQVGKLHICTNKWKANPAAVHPAMPCHD